MSNFSGLAFSIVLALAAIAAALVCARARPPARGYARFAFALYFTVAAANAAGIVSGGTTVPRIAMALSQMVAALGPVALALAVAAARGLRPSAGIAGIALVAACLCAIAAVVTGLAVLAFAPLLLSAIAIAIVSLRQWRTARDAALYAVASAFALVAGAASSMNTGAGGVTGSVLFCAAALLGFSLALVRASRAFVEPQAPADLRILPVSRDH
ncbi:MAG TPA: hypothetical protein VH000_06365 [Rhizomicrobium sp.]|jgi:hypothetical protein|nr:hypothetical protein [Rhizomicrobium sp.]